jgi:hypothetical protein
MPLIGLPKNSAFAARRQVRISIFISTAEYPVSYDWRTRPERVRYT